MTFKDTHCFIEYMEIHITGTTAGISPFSVQFHVPLIKKKKRVATKLGRFLGRDTWERLLGHLPKKILLRIWSIFFNFPSF
jgi:hypothetical protein